MANTRTQTVTIFPISFAIILARALKKLAAWRLEEGSSLETLEQLIGSLSTGSTLSTIYTLRSLNFLAVGLVALWALSPIGGQASLFIIDTELVPVFSDLDVKYLDTNGNTGFAPGDDNRISQALNALLSSSLMTPTSTKSSNHDLWGNVKIPSLLQAGPTNSSGWIPIANGSDGTTSYASLLGVPVINNFASGNTTFLMETSYISVSCLNVTSGPPIPVAHEIGGLVDMGAINSTNGTFSSGIFEYTDSVPNLSFALDGFDDIRLYFDGPINSSDYPPASAQHQRTLLVQSLITDESISSGLEARAYCPLSTIYLTTSVLCIEDNCRVVAIQPSQQPHAPFDLIPFANAGTFGEFGGRLARASPIPVGMASHMSSAVELYIQDYTFIESGGLLTETSNLASVPIADFSLRLQQVINAYWQGSFDPTSMMGTINTDFVAMRSATAKNVVWRSVYRCQWGWWIAYVLSTTAMLIAAIASMTLDLLLRSPELLGYCSSLVRDSRFFDSRYGTGSALGGAERARIFKTLKLKLVDVGAEKGSARLAVVQDDGTREGQPLKRGRLYC